MTYIVTEYADVSISFGLGKGFLKAHKATKRYTTAIMGGDFDYDSSHFILEIH